jgi:DNA-binding SARP family transcriptional activator
MWRLSVFGGLRVTGDVDPGPSAGQRRPLALLALLAAAGEAGLSRDKLLPYLWPESDDERGRNALRQLLHGLRRDLKEPELFRGTTVLSLDPTRITTDVGELEEALAAGELARAAEVYRGAFLDGFHLDGAPEFAYWADLERADYAARVGSALKQLARQADDSGDKEAALRWWRTLATMDPLDSGVALQLMKVLVATGNPAGALQHARVHETLLRDELGGSPDAAVTEMAAKIRAGTGQSSPTSPAPMKGVSTQTDGGEKLRAPTLRDVLQKELAGRYDLQSELPQREGTTRTLIAHDLRHSRQVAIKVLHPSLASALDQERFLQEIAITGRLQHPGILPLLDSGEAGGRPWFVVAHPGGESLRERLTRVERIPREEAVRIAMDLAGALEYAHRQGIVHRDLRPENILLVDNRAVIANLGVARALDRAAGPSLTATGVLVGSPGYMSPEQAIGVSDIDGRSDVYGLGCMLYEMLAGVPVHTGPTPQAILVRRMKSATQPAPLALGPLPPGLGPVIRRALAPLSADRYQTAAELVAALENIGEKPAAKRAPAWGPWTAAVVFLLLLAGLLYWITR